MNIIWSPLASEKLNEIAEHIALDKAEAALKWVNTIFEKVEKLTTFPNQGRTVPELKSNLYRELIIGNYRVIYKVSDSQIFILTIRNFKQNLSHKDLSTNQSTS